MAFLWWGRKPPTPTEPPLPPEVEETNSDTAKEHRRQAVVLAEEIKEDRGALVKREAVYRDALKELRLLQDAGLPAAPQRPVVDGLARRLRNAQSRVEEKLAYGRFFYPEYFK